MRWNLGGIEVEFTVSVRREVPSEKRRTSAERHIEIQCSLTVLLCHFRYGTGPKSQKIDNTELKQVWTVSYGFGEDLCFSTSTISETAYRMFANQ